MASRLAIASRSLAAGQPESAKAAVLSAVAAMAESRELKSHPIYALASELPWLREDVAALAAVSEAARLGSQAGLRVAEAAAASRSVEGSLWRSFYAGGRVRLEMIVGLESPLAEARTLVHSARATISSAPPPSLDRVADVVNRSRTFLRDTSAQLRKARALIEVLPALLGRESPRRYLLAFQSLGEARGTGGLIGHFGVLSARRGRLRLVHVGPIEELIGRSTHPSEASVPAWYRRHYGVQASHRWVLSNLSPSFPLVGRVWLALFHGSTGQRLDGVIAMDPVSFRLLTRATSPLEVRGLRREVKPSNALDILLDDSYDLTYRRQNEYISRLVMSLWDRLSSGRFRAGRLVQALVRSATTGHLKIYMEARDLGRAVDLLDVDGALDAGRNVQMVFHNNAAGNKVDYFLDEKIDTSVKLEGSDALVTTTMGLNNEAPEGRSSYQLGPAIEGDPPGLNRMELNLIVPRDARVLEYLVGDAARRPLRDREGDYAVYWDVIEVRAGRSKQVRVRYRIPDAVTGWKSDRRRFRFALLPQVSAHAPRFRLRITVDDGRLRAGNGDLVTSYSTSGRLRKKQVVVVSLTSLAS